MEALFHHNIGVASRVPTVTVCFPSVAEFMNAVLVLVQLVVSIRPNQMDTKAGVIVSHNGINHNGVNLIRVHH